MLNKALQLHTKLFDAEAERAPIRNGFGEGLLDAGSEDDRIVGVCADLKESVRMHLFAEKFPERFIETGIMEQHMASLGAGLAAMGKIPFVASYSMFNPGRNWEQIRTTICYNNVPVKVVGSHSGVAVGPDGGSHQALEDIALMRVIPNMDVVVPADVHEAYRATRALVNHIACGRIKCCVPACSGISEAEVHAASLHQPGNIPRLRWGALPAHKQLPSSHATASIVRAPIQLAPPSIV